MVGRRIINQKITFTRSNLCLTIAWRRGCSTYSWKGDKLSVWSINISSSFWFFTPSLDPNTFWKSSSILSFSKTIPVSHLCSMTGMALGTLFKIVFNMTSSILSDWARLAPFKIRYVHISAFLPEIYNTYQTLYHCSEVQMLTIGGHMQRSPHLLILILQEARLFWQEDVDDLLRPLRVWPRSHMEDSVSPILCDCCQVNLESSLQFFNNEEDGICTSSFSSLCEKCVVFKVSSFIREKKIISTSKRYFVIVLLSAFFRNWSMASMSSL